MRRPWPALGLILGSALVLVALYLPWQRSSVDLSEYFGQDSESVRELLHLFVGSESLDAWHSKVTPALALSALLLVAVAAAGLVRPQMGGHLPLGRCALLVAYFAFALVVDSHSREEFTPPDVAEGVTVGYRLAYGAYLGIAGALALLLAGALLRRKELLRDRSAVGWATVVLVVGLLAAFLLPWARFPWQSEAGIDLPAAQVAATVALCIPAVAGPGWRLGLAAAAALFTAAALSSVTFPFGRAYGVWVGLGFAIALVALLLARGIRVPDVARLPWNRLLMGATALLFTAALFLPWQEYCYPLGGFEAGRCVAPNGWSTAGSAAAVLAIAAAAIALVPLGRRLSPLELAAGTGLLVTTLGFQLTERGLVRLGFGFWIGAALAVPLLALALMGIDRRRLQWDARLVPIAVCLGYLAVVVPPWGSVVELPEDFRWAFWFAPFSWLTITGALLCLTLIRLWLERSGPTIALLLIPGAMAALAAVDLARFEELTWGGGIVLGLCTLLALLGRIEQTRGLELPHVLRIDRL